MQYSPLYEMSSNSPLHMSLWIWGLKPMCLNMHDVVDSILGVEGCVVCDTLYPHKYKLIIKEKKSCEIT